MTAQEQGIALQPGFRGRRFIAVDLDGTLAVYDGWRGKGHIGEPIPKMAERVKGWLGEGHVVVVFTSRVCDDAQAQEDGIFATIHTWCERHLGQRLFVTATKEKWIHEFWDDRAIHVKPNDGDPCCPAVPAVLT